ncbi:hypothetical protein HDV04_002705 [Boothiomyces sp. JEL0838]|nr:hypothetical protein HDV04_002705 [Boothiomyces sp. JEL0838]
MIPTLLHLRPALRIYRQLFRIQPRLFHQFNRNGISSFKPTLNSKFNLQVKPINYKAIAAQIKPHAIASKIYSVVKYSIISLLVFISILPYIPDFLSTLTKLGAISVLALAAGLVGPYLLVGIFLYLGVITIPMIHLACEIVKIFEAKELPKGWKVVPMEARDIISWENDGSMFDKICINIDFFTVETIPAETYYEVLKIVADSTDLKGKVSIQRDYFGWWMYSIPFDLDHVNQPKQH